MNSLRTVLALLVCAVLLGGMAVSHAELLAETAEISGLQTSSTAEEKEADSQEDSAEPPLTMQIPEGDSAIAYVLICLPDPIGLLPLPSEGEYTRTVRQTMEDGSEAINTLHLTTEGFWMEEANCAGQDCVKEGKVTLENREERLLGNLVVCLPHRLTAQLITREEAERLQETDR